MNNPMSMNNPMNNQINNPMMMPSPMYTPSVQSGGNGTLIADLINKPRTPQLPQSPLAYPVTTSRSDQYSDIKELADDVNHSLSALEEIDTIKKKKKKKNKKKKEKFSKTANDDENTDEEEKNTQQDSTNSENKDNQDNQDNQDSQSGQDVDTVLVETDTNYGKIFIEPIILLTLYVIMSQPFVISFASKYIKQLTPNEDGSVNMSGIVIYGIILTILFLGIRKLVYSRF